MRNPSIAIVGMAGRFPGARDVDAFWRNLRDGVESIRVLSDAELRAAGVSAEELADPDYVKAAAVLEDIDKFDASFFGFSPRDAAIMDPQHRFFLECAWEAIENAGHTPENFPGPIGVFAGSGMNAYMVYNLLQNRRLLESAGMFLLRQTGNDKDVLATRVSYQFDLRGPSMSVQTACSTSLVAVHLACQSLLHAECDMALAGGVTIEVPHARGHLYREGEILSRDGHCRAFDATSSGTVFSSGVGIVVLRRLEDALADHDAIHAVILGSAVNNDGARKVGYLAPSVDGQAEVIAEALGVAGVGAEDISYIETHGTGTAIGDPIEIKGLTQAFRAETDRKGYCAVGSLKTNIGHMDTAAGVAGLIKTVLALRHQKLPPSLHFKTPNPLIDFQQTPFYVNSTLADWPSHGRPRRAGVTALGIGGTNAHVVLEEAPEARLARPSQPQQVIVLSAKTETALEQATSRLAAYLREHPAVDLEDVAFTCQMGRKAFPHRRALVADDTAGAIGLLTSVDPRRVFTGTAMPSAPSVVFMFSGQGAQYGNMGAELYRSGAVFRGYMDTCAEGLQPHLGLDIRDLLYPKDAGPSNAAEMLDQTYITQPALFSIEYALAQWWMAHGVSPQAMVGHSVGEYVAACIAGVFSLEDALAVIAARGRLMQQMAPGSMLAVQLAPEGLALPEGLCLAAINAPQQCVVSGPTDAIRKMEQELTQKDIFCRVLQTSHAFHSSMMDPMLAEFKDQFAAMKLHAPRVPYMSNLTGTWATEAQATDPGYWVQQLRNTVQFSSSITELLRSTGRVMLEVGPGQTLASLVRRHDMGGARAFSSMRRQEEQIPDTTYLENTLGQLWTIGAPVDWQALHVGATPQRVPLPTYPFERQSHWIQPDTVLGQTHTSKLQTKDLPVSPVASNWGSQDHWFYQRTWGRSQLPTVQSPAPMCWLVFMDTTGLGKQISIQLQGTGQRVIHVLPGKRFKRTGRNEYTVRPGSREDHVALLQDLDKRKSCPQKVLYLWSLYGEGAIYTQEERLDHDFYGLLHLLQALGDQDQTNVDLAVISKQLHPVQDGRPEGPLSAVLLGPVKVAPKEFPGMVCRNIDIEDPSGQAGKIAVQIIAEHCSPFQDQIVAYRNDERWVEGLQHVTMAPRQPAGRLKEKGVYLITGGTGGLGMAIAEHLARTYHARLILLGRTPLPAENEWMEALDSKDVPAEIKNKISKLQGLKSYGAEVLALCADITHIADVERSIVLARERFGEINGIIHAAGVLEDGPLQTKTRESAARVLAPKVQGTQALYGALHGAPLDFFVLFSSISSYLPPAGQVDYAAANAFLDAFAASHQGDNVSSIQWGPWRDIGMTAHRGPSHPLIGERLVPSPKEIVCTTHLSCTNHWPLAEHRISTGMAVFPGTGFLEMAAGALIDGNFGAGLEFEDVFFLSPLFAYPDEVREVRMQLQREGDRGHRFTISTNDPEWKEHASGMIAPCTQAPPKDRDLSAARARCQLHTIQFDDKQRTHQEAFFHFGPRWKNLKAVHLGHQEAIAELELDADFISDTLTYNMHPALLDLATGAALYLIKDYGETPSVYMPLSYKKVVVYRPLCHKIYSHIRSGKGNTSGQEVATFDLTLMDGDGRALAEIEGFSMRLVRDPMSAFQARRVQTPSGTLQNASTTMQSATGIAPEEGAVAFTRILNSDVPPGVIVSSQELALGATVSSPPYRLGAQKTVPSNDVEGALTEWWKELLGVDSITVDEDFFALGGQSLIVARLFSKIKKTYGVSLGLSTLFEARTIRQLSRLVRQARDVDKQAPGPWSPIVPVQPKGTDLPLFVISGLGGNVIKFHSMAFHLGEDQPVYGLLPRGLDGRAPYFTRVEDLASYYVDAIRGMQPEGPYRLVGYSFGGAVAFEVAQQIVSQGGRIGLLGMFDTIEWQYMEQVERALHSRDRLELYRQQLRGEMAGEEKLSGIKRRLAAKSTRLVYRLFHAMGRPVPQGIGDIEDINAFAGSIYRPKIYPGKLDLFRSTQREPLDGDDEFLGWGGLVAGGIDVHPVPATHETILQEPSVQVLAGQLRACLDRDRAATQSVLKMAHT